MPFECNPESSFIRNIPTSLLKQAVGRLHQKPPGDKLGPELVEIEPISPRVIQQDVLYRVTESK